MNTILVLLICRFNWLRGLSMSCPERINDIDLDRLDQNFILSTQSDSNNAFQGSLMKILGFLTGKNEK